MKRKFCWILISYRWKRCCRSKNARSVFRPHNAWEIWIRNNQWSVWSFGRGNPMIRVMSSFSKSSILKWFPSKLNAKSVFSNSSVFGDNLFIRELLNAAVLEIQYNQVRRFKANWYITIQSKTIHLSKRLRGKKLQRLRGYSPDSSCWGLLF